MIPYENLEKHFTAPKRISPFFNFKRVPRKLKKKYNIRDKKQINQRLWFIQSLTNPDYNRFLIKQICKK